MSLYRFKSRETGDLVMLQPHGQQILALLGKNTVSGIIQAAEMPAAVELIKAAVVAEEAEQKRMREDAAEAGEAPPDFDAVGLRVRSAPFIAMLQRCAQAEVEIVWGV